MYFIEMLNRSINRFLHQKWCQVEKIVLLLSSEKKIKDSIIIY